MERDLVASFFASRHIILKDKWLDEVMKYLENETAQSTPQTAVSLCDQVYEQWLFSELCSSTQPVIRIPPYVKKVVVKGQCTLQVNWFINISQSAYSQFRLLTQHFEDNSGFGCGAIEDNHDERNNSQFLLMEVTDGQRKLRAISSGDIDGLSIKSAPGIKIYLFADVLCRRNILTLTPLNTQVLGGDVDAILDISTPVHIIARRVNIDDSKLQRIERSVVEADGKTEWKERMEVQEGADIQIAANNDIEGTQAGGSTLNKRNIAEVDIKLGKGQEMHVGCGTKARAVGDCASEEGTRGPTILMSETECVKNMMDEETNTIVVPVIPTVGKTVEREGCERPSTLKLQGGITMRIIPHNGPQLGDENVGEKWNGANKDGSNQSTGWNKRTLDEATLKEVDSKLKKTAKKKYVKGECKEGDSYQKYKTAFLSFSWKGPPVGMRTITSYYSPVRRLREAESGKLAPFYNSLSAKADSALKMGTVDNESRALRFQAAVNEDSNGLCVNKDVDPYTLRQTTTAKEGQSHCHQAPELEDSDQRFYDQIPSLEYVTRPTCGQMHGVGDAGWHTFDKTLELESTAHPFCRQLPMVGDSNRHDCRQEPVPENIDSLVDRRLEGFNKGGANISHIFQKASNLHSTLPFPVRCEQPVGRISKGTFLEKFDKMYKKKAESTPEKNIERQATTSENMLRNNILQPSSIGLPWQRKEHEHSAMPVYRKLVNNKEVRTDSYTNTLWNAIRNTTNETIYSPEHNESGIIPPIWDSKRRNISPSSRSNASFVRVPYANSELSKVEYQKSPLNTQRRDDDVWGAEDRHESFSPLDDGNALVTPSTTRPVNEVQPLQSVLKIDRPVAVVDQRFSLTPRKRRLDEYCPSTNIAPFKTLSTYTSGRCTQRSSLENGSAVMKTDEKHIGSPSSTSHFITSNRPFTMFDVPTSNAKRSTSSDCEIVRRFQHLRIMTLADIDRSREFWMIAQQKRIQPISCEVIGSLQVSSDGWLVKVLVTDHTARDLFCIVENDALERLLGFSFKECKRLFAAKERNKLLQYKRRAINVLQLFTRLDLVLTIEFSPLFDIVPLIVDITNLANALGIC